jgi:integrase
MSVYRPKHSDGSFRSPYYHFDFVVTVHGERRRVHGSTGETTLKAAKEYARKERQRVLREGPNDGMTLAAACERYVDEVLVDKRSGEDTVVGLAHCCRLIGADRRLANITADDIAQASVARARETIGKRKVRAVSNATVNRQIIEPMRAVMTRAMKVWGVSCEPHKIMWRELMRREAGPRVRELSEDESKAFWEAIRPDFIPATAFLLRRGFRIRAALGMQKTDADLPGRRVRVWRKGDGYVWQRISDADAALLEVEMRKSPLPCVWTYEVQRGAEAGLRRPLTYAGYRRSFETALRRAGIENFRRHDMRHDFATKLLRATRNLALVQKCLGHSDISSTMVYAHVLDDDVFDGLNDLSRNYTELVIAPALK